MCGIAGFLDISARIDDPLAVLLAMGNRLAHRGPDGHGEWFGRESGIGLAHRRLSIIDLSAAGAQPMESRCGRWIAVFNGEIYNHQAMRLELGASRSVAWRGTSDTETLLEAISTWGVGATLPRINGMFAVALWDRKERCLHLLRDRFGEKPLYYGWVAGVFVFASELKALRALPGWSPIVDPDSVGELMRFAYIPAPFSIYRGISKQEPGTWLVLPGAAAADTPPTRYQYWHPFEAMAAARLEGLEEDTVGACDTVEHVLRTAVSQRMQSDVPLGAFLSGGIDSSLITALMQANSQTRIRTFSIGLREADADESGFARQVAASLGTQHTEFIVTARDAFEVIPQLPRIYDEPFADSSQIPTFLVARLARAHVTVALSGDGGDELFGGYNRHVYGPDLWRRISGLPDWSRGLLERILAAVPVKTWDGLGQLSGSFGIRHRMLGHKLHKLARVLGAKDAQQFYQGLASFWPDPSHVVLRARTRSATLLDIGRWPPDLDLGETMMAMDSVTYLPDDILVKVDRATMASGLEGRVPFLDPQVFAAAWRLPQSLKVRDSVGKWILREILYRYVPRDLVDRPKSGFGIPVGDWLRGPLREWAGDLLSPAALRRVGFLDADAVSEVWTHHQRGADGLEFHLWNALMFQAWSTESAE
jgi:asparagine synthase (glutamine-hydrolysing)